MDLYKILLVDDEVDVLRAMKKKIGAPDLLILFTSTVSHKMVNCAVEEAKKKSIPVCRCHTSSASALESILREYCA